MFKDPSEKSLAEILQSRRDTVFEAIPREDPESHLLAGEKIYHDEMGNGYYHIHDYIGTKSSDGRPVGILVADHDSMNCMDHPPKIL